MVQARTRDEGPAWCTECGISSDRVHSRYVRRLADRAIGGRAVRIGLSVRRLYCENPACSKVTFAEQVDGLTVRYQRRTPLLQKVVETVGVLLAGRGGARLLGLLNTPLSRTSVLFQLMRVPLPAGMTPRVLGVDDFALYAGVYGTLLVDGDTRLPITLWEGRDAASLAAWLREHPGVEVVCRDGSLAYRQGITDGAPQALQVSDLFHLWQGLSRRVQDVSAAHRSCLAAAVLPPAEHEESQPAPDEGPSLETTRAGRHAKRLFEAVHEHTGTGRSISAGCPASRGRRVAGSAGTYCSLVDQSRWSRRGPRSLRRRGCTATPSRPGSWRSNRLCGPKSLRPCLARPSSNPPPRSLR
ncbi:ISL3 family transposase [Streptomyces sp. R39]|uniref:ISL3 family transposase n=1 Tax=Streptomyces sp. R39 TaxID=3238631 RepID=A0AB39R829_9ACTN